MTSTVKLQAIVKTLSADEKRLCTVVASRITDAEGQPYIDSDGDVLDIDQAEQAFIESFSSGGFGKSGVEHKTQGGADVVEMFVVTKADRDALGFGDGDQMVIAKIHVTDDSIWKSIKAGDLPEVSIEGTGTREAINA